MNFKTKKFIAFFTMMIVVGLAAISTVSAEEAKKETIKLVASTMVQETSVYYKTLTKFGELLKKYYSSSPIEIDIFHSGALGPDKDTFETLLQGISVDYMMIAPSWITSFDKKSAFLDTPFIWANEKHWEKAMTSDVFEPIEKSLLAKGGRILGYAGGGIRNLILREPIYSTKDLPKVELRVMGSPIQAAVFNATGMKATPIDYLETYNAIRLGVVDGLENEAMTYETMKFYEVAPYYILTKHCITVRPIVFSEKRFQSFPNELQEAILKAGKEAAKFGRETELKGSDIVVQELAKKGLIKVIEFDNSEMRQRATPVIDAYAKELGLEDVLANIKKLQ